MKNISLFFLNSYPGKIRLRWITKLTQPEKKMKEKTENMKKSSNIKILV